MATGQILKQYLRIICRTIMCNTSSYECLDMRQLCNLGKSKMATGQILKQYLRIICRTIMCNTSS